MARSDVGIAGETGRPDSVPYQGIRTEIVNRLLLGGQCPSWFETISFQVEFHTPKLKAYTFELKPYTTKQIANVSFEITSFTFTPISLLNQRFFTNNNSTAYVPPDTEFSYACSSDPRHNDMIHDQTKHATAILQKTLSTAINTFPLPIPQGLISTQGHNNIPTITTRAVSVQLMITFNHTIKEITQEIQNFQCSILPQRLFGCYNCVKGSVATLF
ncbi:hypothetical protein COOONC_15149, partial [Cooperia oncophora]